MASDKDSSSDAGNNQGLSALYNGVLQNLAMAQDAVNAVETKSNTVLAAALVVIALIFDKTDKWYAFSVAGALLLATAVALALAGTRVKDYGSATIALKEHPEYLQMQNDDLLKQLIADAEKSYDDTADKLEAKAAIYQWAVIAFAVGGALSVLGHYLKIVKI